MIPPRFRVGCAECDDRPLCPICERPIQLGGPAHCWSGRGPEPYHRGLIWAFDTRPAFDAAWDAHAPHRGSWAIADLTLDLHPAES